MKLPWTSPWNVFEGTAQNKGWFFEWFKLRKKKKGGKIKNPKAWQVHLGRRKPFSPWHTPLWHTQLPGRWLGPPGTRRSHSGCCSTSPRGTWWCHHPGSSLWKTHTPHSTSQGAAPCSAPKSINQQWAAWSPWHSRMYSQGIRGGWFFSTFSQVTEPQVSLRHLTSPLWHTHTVQAFFFHCSPCCWERAWTQLLNTLGKPPSFFQKPELLMEYYGSFCMSASDNKLFFKNADL